MISLFKKLSLPNKLILIGIIPLLFLIGISVDYYLFEKQKLNLLNDDVRLVTRSTTVAQLLDELQEERRLAYEYSLKKTSHPQLLIQRKRTDSILNVLNSDPELRGFEKYTMLGDLQETRIHNDQQKLPPILVMSYYTTAIFRISMLEVTPQLQIPDARQLNKDLHGARAMSQIITYLGIIRSNIYNVMYTRQFQYGNGTLIGLYGVYQVYTSYQTEFKQKTSPKSLADYKYVAQHTSLKPINDYLSKSFKVVKFDSTTYNDKQWWQLSGNAEDQLRGVQSRLWNDIASQLTSIKHTEDAKVTGLLILLLFALTLSIIFIIFSINSINKTLENLKVAAEKIAIGETGISLDTSPDDVIGRLARSVLLIDANNKMITEAAEEIRKGNFSVAVTPRAPTDILGNALLQMKDELQRNSEKITRYAEELEHLLTAVKESENHFRLIADQTPLMIWQVNAKGETIYVNKQWTVFTGMTQDESIGTGWIKALHPDDKKNAKFPIAYADRVPFKSKARFRNSNGDYCWTLIHADPIYTHGLFEGYLGSITDINDQVLAQQALEELMDRKDEFLTVASHELKTPLTSIKAYTQILRKITPQTEKSYPVVNKVLQHVDRLEKLVRDLLDVSRINSGQMVYDIAEFQFEEILHETVSHFRDVAKKHSIKIDQSIPAVINGDRLRIEQVLNNLINNAIKYSPDADIIIISTTVNENELVISVQDFGVGIESKDISMLFDKFFRTEKNFYRFQGLGLGLFISNEIVNRHGGKIWAESEPGKGSVFYFTLPVVSPASEKSILFS